MNLYEQIGRLTEQLADENASHRKTVGVLVGLKTGEISLDQLTVDPATASWAVAPAAPFNGIECLNPPDGDDAVLTAEPASATD